MRDIISLQRSPFFTVPRSFLKVMTMTTGEFDFDAVFRQDPSGEGDDADEILFPCVAVILHTLLKEKENHTLPFPVG